MQMSAAKRRLSGPATYHIIRLMHSKAAVSTVDDVVRFIKI